MACNNLSIYSLLILAQVVSLICADDSLLDSNNSNSIVPTNWRRQRKTITVGDEFPSISVRIFNNLTEYEIRLNTSNYECSDAFICEAFIPLTEMYCQNSTTSSKNQPYLEINGMTGSGERLSVRWCQDYGIFAQDDFLNLKVQNALITPKGDWSDTNATVVIIATFNKVETVVKSKKKILVGNLPVNLNITNTKTEFEFSLDRNNEGCQGNINSTGYCSIGAHVEINCPGKSKDSAYLQLDLLLRNNETVSKIFCLIRDANDNGGQSNISAYLANIQTVTLKPMGNWESLNTHAHVQLQTVISSRVAKCPMDYFDCSTECGISAGTTTTTTTVTGIKRGKVLGSMEPTPSEVSVPLNFTTIVDINDSEDKLSCIPWTWVCGNGQENENCPESCTAAQKFCPTVSPTSTGAAKSKKRAGNAIRQCLFYYGFFLIPFGFILIIFSGTFMFIKLGMLRKKRNESVGGMREERRRDSNSNSNSMFPIQLFGRLKRNIPYQVVENDTT